MPIDEGVNVDLQFLIIEVKKQARASLSYLEKPTRGKLKKIKESQWNTKGNQRNSSDNQIHGKPRKN